MGAFKSSDTTLIKENAERPADKNRGSHKPTAVPERRDDHNVDFCPLLIPNAVAVGGRHLERISPRRHVRIVRSAAGSGVDPVCIPSDQFVLETHALRADKAQTRVIDLEVDVTGLQRET